MATLRCSVPSLLRPFTAGRGSFEVQAGTLEEALGALVERFPMLERHLWDEDGQQREHVNIFYNGRPLRWMTDLSIPVADGDEIVVLQAVSGGRAGTA